MPLSEWINIKVIKALCQHGSGTLFAVGVFWLAGEAVKRGVHDEQTRRVIDIIESYVLIALWITLAVQMFWHIWKGRGNGRPILVA